jgi:hypothetical protein
MESKGVPLYVVTCLYWVYLWHFFFMLHQGTWLFTGLRMPVSFKQHILCLDDSFVWNGSINNTQQSRNPVRMRWSIGDIHLVPSMWDSVQKQATKYDISTFMQDNAQFINDYYLTANFPYCSLSVYLLSPLAMICVFLQVSIFSEEHVWHVQCRYSFSGLTWMPTLWQKLI